MPARTAKPYVNSSSAAFLQTLDPVVARDIAEELKALPTLEQAAASVMALPEVPGYRAIVLPSGYTIVYRRLEPGEEVKGEIPPDPDNTYFIADIEPPGADIEAPFAKYVRMLKKHRTK